MGPPGFARTDDPLQYTGWRPVEQYDISSPLRSKGEGKGKAGKGGTDRGNLYEQKGFDKRCQKFSNEKVGLAGEQDFKNSVFDIRKISEHVPYFDKFLEWLCEEQEEITEEVLRKKQEEIHRNLRDENGDAWETAYFNRQLYGVLRETCVGSAKNSVMSYEDDTTINGARLLQEFAREHLHGSKVGLAALGQRITKPPRATLETLEDRLREWDSDCRRWLRMTRQSPGELALVYLQDMLPEAAVAKFELLKHDILFVQRNEECLQEDNR